MKPLLTSQPLSWRVWLFIGRVIAGVWHTRESAQLVGGRLDIAPRANAGTDARPLTPVGAQVAAQP